MANRKDMTRLLLALQIVWLVVGCASSRPDRSMPAGKGVYHIVQRGETLWGISRQYGVNVAALAETNRLKDPSRIEVGQRLRIPRADRSPARVVSTGAPSARPAFIWPVSGNVVDVFRVEEKSKNNGIDIAAPAGGDVLASLAGEVMFSGKGPGAYGNTVIIDHRNGYTTVYAYNLENLVVKGQEVSQGEKIARVGLGNAAVPSLHFEIRKDTVPYNPLRLLPANEEVSYDG